MRRLSFLLFLLAMNSKAAFAFPDMIRHGYANCNTCHVSPSGGGILTDYGREISAEVLATWSRENENQFLHGGVKLPDSLKFGGDIRSIQTYVDTPQVREGQWFLMQADLEAAYVSERITIDATVGYDPGSPKDDDDNEFVSRRHYVLVPFGESWSVRAGKYLMNYGLMIPDHVAQIRGGLGFNQGSETYNAEVNYMSERYAASVTAVGGRPDDKSVPSEKGVAFNGSVFLEPSYKIGLSYFHAKSNDEVERDVYGPYLALGFMKRMFLLMEADMVRIKPAGGGKELEGFATYLKPGISLFKGFDFHLVHETKKNDRTRSDLDFLAYGAGFQWSPRPHFIFTGQWEKQLRPSSLQARTFDYAYFIAQYAI